MPIFRINNDLHYFAHVPKCGGSSVETYLKDRFGPIALWDISRFNQQPDQRWSRTSPQHIPAAALDQIIPADWLLSSFAIVRHPVRRLISAFFYARDVFGRIPLSTEFNAWFAGAAALIMDDPFCLAGHFAPQSSFVPKDSRIFRLEDGLHHIIPYLDKLAGNEDGPREMPTRNIGRWRREEPPPVPTMATLDLACRIYAEDFARFGYDQPSSIVGSTALPDLPALVSTGKPPVPTRHSAKTRAIRYLLRKAGQ
jgi:Sulfotransferase family